MSSSDRNTPPLGRLALAREDVDRGCEERSQPGWLDTIWNSGQARVLWLQGGRAPVSAGQLVLSDPVGELPADAVYLGRSSEHVSSEVSEAVGHVELVLVTADPADPVPDLVGAQTGQETVPTHEVHWAGVRDIAAALEDRDVGMLVEAVAVTNWHQKNGFCPRCGSTTTVTNAGWVRVCDQEGDEIFPRTDPAIIAAITDPDDRILLGNNAAWGANRYSTLAGFVEPGESLEAAVIREVHEESNLRVHSPRYLGSQPWPFPQSLMLGFTARTEHPEEIKADGEEVLNVRWFTREELRAASGSGEVLIPGAASIARALLEHWYGGPLPEPSTLEN